MAIHLILLRFYFGLDSTQQKYEAMIHGVPKHEQVQ